MKVVDKYSHTGSLTLAHLHTTHTLSCTLTYTLSYTLSCTHTHATLTLSHSHSLSHTHSPHTRTHTHASPAVWSTFSAATLLAPESMERKRYLLFYPVFLLFAYLVTLNSGA